MLLSDAIKKSRKKATKQEPKQAAAPAPAPAPAATPAPEERATMSDANAIASAIKAKMGVHRTEYYGNTPVHIDRDPDVNVFVEWGRIRINVGYDTEEDEAESYHVDEWIRKLNPVLATYMSKIKRVRVEPEEKGWISTDIFLK